MNWEYGGHILSIGIAFKSSLSLSGFDWMITAMGNCFEEDKEKKNTTMHLTDIHWNL